MAGWTETQGEVWLAGRPGALTERQPCTVAWLVRDDQSFEVRFPTSHRLSVPPGTVGGVWLRFVDSAGQNEICRAVGSQDDVFIIASELSGG